MFKHFKMEEFKLYSKADHITIKYGHKQSEFKIMVNHQI